VAAAAGLAHGSDRAEIAFSMSWVYGVNAGFALLALIMTIPMYMARRKARAD